MEFFALLLGIAGLWLGTQATIKGAVAVAERLGVPELVVGLTVVSVGSDLPELAIGIDAAIWNLHAGQASDVVVGSALGSCLGQIGFVLGIAGLLGRLTLPKKIIYQQGGVLLGSLVLLGLFGLDVQVSRIEGILLVAAYAAYLIFVLANVTLPEEHVGRGSGSDLAKSLFFLAIGLAVVIGSAELTVSSAVSFAEALNVEQSFVAIIIIGLGSSLPELSISLGAVLQRRVSLSVGNLMGSNVFDTLVPVGAAATIARLDFDADMLQQELPFLFVLTLIVLFLFLKSSGIRKREAIVVLGLYVAYAAAKIQEVI